MTNAEALGMAQSLLASYGDRAFEISMPDESSYDLMRNTLADLGRESGPDGEFFIIKVFPVPEGGSHFSPSTDPRDH